MGDTAGVSLVDVSLVDVSLGASVIDGWIATGVVIQYSGVPLEKTIAIPIKDVLFFP